MIEPTTSTTSGTAEDADQGATAEASSRTEDPNPNHDAEPSAEPTASDADGNGVFAEAADQPPAEARQQPRHEDQTEERHEDQTAEGAAGATGDGATAEKPAEPEEPEESEAEKVARLEREGDVAADYLEELLDIADVDGDIDLDVEGDRAVVAVVGGDLRRLTGSDGEVLDALQELTRLAVLRETGGRSRLMLDVGGFRARRRQELEKRAATIADDVIASGNPVRMDPMTPFERKIVHDTVAGKGLVSESEGEEPNRRVVVKPS